MGLNRIGNSPSGNIDDYVVADCDNEEEKEIERPIEFLPAEGPGPIVLFKLTLDRDGTLKRARPELSSQPITVHIASDRSAARTHSRAHAAGIAAS